MFMNDVGLSSSDYADEMLKILKQLGIRLKVIVRDVTLLWEEGEFANLDKNVHKLWVLYAKLYA